MFSHNFQLYLGTDMQILMSKIFKKLSRLLSKFSSVPQQPHPTSSSAFPLRASLEGFDNHSEVPSMSSNAGGIGKDSIYNQVYNFGVC